MHLQAELPTVVAFTSQSLRSNLTLRKPKQAEKILAFIKECQICDQDFNQAALMRNAQKECKALVESTKAKRTKTKTKKS